MTNRVPGQVHYGPVQTIARGENLLINGDFRVAQRGTSFTAATVPNNSDDFYLLDRWILLSDGSDIVDVSQETTTVPTGAYAACKFLVATINKKAGILQIIEARDTAGIVSGKTSLSFEARTTGTEVGNIRAGVIEWTDAADSPTSDVVSAWNAAGSDPTLVANWAYVNTPANLALTASYQRFRLNSISIGSSATNVGVFIWTDDDDMALNDTLYIGNVKLESGDFASDFFARTYAEEEALAMRYYERHGDQTDSHLLVGGTNSFGTERMPFQWKTKKRTDPSVSKVGTWNVTNAGQPTIDESDEHGYVLTSVVSAAAATWVYHADTAGEYVEGDAEL